MARHKDISRAHALLEGEGWHIEDKTVQYNTHSKRRNKRKCRYYLCVSDTCALTRYNCKGSSKCKQYRVQAYNRLVALYMGVLRRYYSSNGIMYRLYRIMALWWIYGACGGVVVCVVQYSRSVSGSFELFKLCIQLR